MAIPIDWFHNSDPKSSGTKSGGPGISWGASRAECRSVSGRPQWSLRQTDSWAFEILRNEGYRYDSSLNPLPFVGDRSGHRFPFEIRAGGGNILEIPPMVTSFPIGNLPTGGGWGFRFFPLRMIDATVRAL